MVDSFTGGTCVLPCACHRSEARGVCETRGAMICRSGSRRCMVAHRDHRRVAIRLLGWLLTRPWDTGSRLGRSMSMMRFALPEAEVQAQAAVVLHLQRGPDKRI
jgi:hypothetical protein